LLPTGWFVNAVFSVVVQLLICLASISCITRRMRPPPQPQPFQGDTNSIALPHAYTFNTSCVCTQRASVACMHIPPFLWLYSSLLTPHCRIADFQDLQTLSHLPTLRDLNMSDPHFGVCPIAKAQGYRSITATR
jgi:hypothetical protein